MGDSRSFWRYSFLTLLQYAKDVLAIFSSYKLDDTSSSTKKSAPTQHQSQQQAQNFFAKYLTSEKVLTILHLFLWNFTQRLKFPPSPPFLLKYVCNIVHHSNFAEHRSYEMQANLLFVTVKRNHWEIWQSWATAFGNFFCHELKIKKVRFCQSCAW